MIITIVLNDVLELSGGLIFAPRIKEVCFELLKKKFAGRCYMGCLVLNILEVLNEPIRQFTESSSANAVATVRFSASAVKYDRYETIFATILRKGEEIEASSIYASIILDPKHLKFDPYQLNTEVPVAVIEVGYAPSESKCSIIAAPFKYRPPTVYEIAGSGSGSGSGSGDYPLDTKTYEKKLETLKSDYADAYKFFTKLIVAPPLKGFKETKMDSIPDSGYVYFSDAVYISDTKPEDCIAIKVESATHLIKLQQLKYYMLLSDLITKYPTKQDAVSHKNIWIIYNSSKPPS